MKTKRRRHGGVARWRHPWPPERYSDQEGWAFFDRENERARTGRLTRQQWLLLPAKKRRAIDDPELTYWRNRVNNEARRGARRARRMRAGVLYSSEGRHDAELFYREVKAAPSIDCFYCHKAVRGRDAEVDHKTPLSRGGKHERANLAAACYQCNRSKGRLTADEFFAKKEAK